MTITLTRRPAVSTDPYSQFRTEVERTIESLMGEPFTPLATLAPRIQRLPGWMPLVDVSETDREYLIRAECPGIGEKDLELSVVGDSVVLAGEKNEETQSSGEDWCRCERRFGSFRRVVELPPTADADRATAEVANGVVTVHVPKRPEAKPRPIAISAGKGK